MSVGPLLTALPAEANEQNEFDTDPQPEGSGNRNASCLRHHVRLRKDINMPLVMPGD